MRPGIHNMNTVTVGRGNLPGRDLFPASCEMSPCLRGAGSFIAHPPVGLGLEQPRRSGLFNVVVTGDGSPRQGRRTRTDADHDGSLSCRPWLENNPFKTGDQSYRSFHNESRQKTAACEFGRGRTDHRRVAANVLRQDSSGAARHVDFAGPSSRQAGHVADGRPGVLRTSGIVGRTKVTQPHHRGINSTSRCRRSVYERKRTPGFEQGQHFERLEYQHHRLGQRRLGHHRQLTATAGATAPLGLTVQRRITQDRNGVSL
jgi:hypothetical protein